MYFSIIATICIVDDYFKCSFCGNEDPKKIGTLNGKLYCRACINFSGQKVDSSKKPKASSFHLPYNLTNEQRKISENILDNYKNGVDTLVDAVTGAGKTELIFGVIDYALNKGQKIGFVAPRREVVIEISHRFKKVFSKNEVVSVFGGHTGKLDGDIVCLTTHQLYRYENFFDLLIFDEVDAFPFKGDSALSHFFDNSLKGNHVLLTATPSKEMLNKYQRKNREVLSLNVRYHGNPLPVPEIIILPSFISAIYMIQRVKEFIKNNKKVFVFVPTIEKREKLFKFANFFIKNGSYIHSKREGKEDIIKKVRKKEIDYLITTSILERGVTFDDLQVVIFDADHKIFSTETLIQISGRVGRKKKYPNGKVVFIGKRKTSEMQGCIEVITRKNRDLQDLF